MQSCYVNVIEDDESLRNSIHDLLVFANYHVRSWPDAESFLNNLPQTAPTVVITDMSLPGLSGLELHQQLIAQGRQIPVIYISGESNRKQTIEAMKLGPVDFLAKPFAREDLLRAVAIGIEKDRVQMREIIEQARFNESLQHLSPRERQVMQLLLQGFNNAEIMEAMHVSLPTAKQYKSTIMRKLQVRSLSQLMKLNAHKQVPERQSQEPVTLASETASTSSPPQTPSPA